MSMEKYDLKSECFGLSEQIIELVSKTKSESFKESSEINQELINLQIDSMRATLVIVERRLDIL